MPLPKETQRDPKDIDTVSYTVSNNKTDTAFKAVASFQLVNAAGVPIKTVAHNMVPHLSAAQITNMKGHITALRTKGIAEIIP